MGANCKTLRLAQPRYSRRRGATCSIALLRTESHVEVAIAGDRWSVVL